ncbi:MAG: tetratricopeptide repeat protein [Paludibacter sp.]
MSRKLSFSMDEESGDLVQRYEQFLSGKANGYFDVEELENIVEYYLRRGRTKDSNSAIDLGLKLHPNNGILKAKRAKIYLITGDEQKAFRLLDSLTESTDYEVVLLKIEVLIKLDRINEAKILTDKLLADESDEMDNVCLDVAYLYLGQSEYETALELLERGYNSNPQNPDLLYELAFCYEQNESLTKAIDVNLQIIDLDPFAGEAWFNLGQLYFAQMDFTKALEAYDYAMAIDDKDMLTCLQKAHVHFQLNQFDEAIETYLEYRSLSTFGYWQTDIFIAECYEKLEKYDDAIVYYKQSLDEQAENYDALTGIAICMLEQEHFAESIPYIENALKINSEAADAWVYLAEAYVGLDDVDNALLAYVKSISIDPEQPDTLMAIANICMEKAEFELALKYYLAARELNETTDYIDLFIAVSYCKLGNLNQATIYLKMAMQTDTNAAVMFAELCPEAEALIYL